MYTLYDIVTIYMYIYTTYTLCSILNVLYTMIDGKENSGGPEERGKAPKYLTALWKK